MSLIPGHKTVWLKYSVWSNHIIDNRDKSLLRIVCKVEGPPQLITLELMLEYQSVAANLTVNMRSFFSNKVNLPYTTKILHADRLVHPNDLRNNQSYLGKNISVERGHISRSTDVGNYKLVIDKIPLLQGTYGFWVNLRKDYTREDAYFNGLILRDTKSYIKYYRTKKDN